MQNQQNPKSRLPQHVAIIGLGLMGGSLALALRGHVATLTGVDASADVCAEAGARGVVDWATTDLARGAAGAGLVVLATPVRSIISLIERLPGLRPGGCDVIDLGSTKREICAAYERLPDGFDTIGGHPMCGKETGGLRHAEASLFRGQTFVLCETAHTSTTMRVQALALVAAIGSTPLWLTPADHDRFTAVSSHLPYLVSSLLMERAAATARDDSAVWQVSASGFRDTGRLAGSDPRMMGDILRTNRDLLLAELTAFETSTAELRRLLENGSYAEIETWLRARQSEHARYRRHKDGPANVSGQPQD